MRLRAMFLIGTAAALLTNGTAEAQQTLFRAVRVFDGRLVTETTDVLVSDGRIARIGTNLPAADATVIDGTGRTLLPGLIDAHTHVYGDALRDALMFGVTTELDQFTNAAAASALRDEQRSGNASARADIFSAGTLATAPGGHGTEYGFEIPTLTSPDQAQAWVDARIAEGSDWIKIVYDDGGTFGARWPSIDNATMRAVVQAAQRRGKLAVVHVSSARAAQHAIEAGANGLVHLFTDSAPAPAFANLARSRGAFVIPTLSVLRSISGTPGGSSLIGDSMLAPYISSANRTQLGMAFPGSGPGRSYDVAVATVRQLLAAGVPILAGTDAPNPGTAHGVSLHGELELLVNAGLTPLQALTAATATPAALFGLKDRGRIEQGLRADVVLVNGDPTKDIRATRAIEGVWKGGVRLDRTAFANALASAQQGAAPPVSNMGDGLIADFEGGAARVKFGFGWLLTTDSLAGGKSSGAFSVVDGGANGSAKSLLISGTISGDLPYAWSGVMWSPGSAPMSAADLSGARGVTFNARGDGGAYKVLVMSQSQGFTPLMWDFTPSREWSEISVPWSAFGIDGKDVMAVMIVGGPAPGPFELRVDNVRIR